tara:strand:+ start:23941 stop:24501 length:561 start_codon:yes stop_codon:yes gene_type:complete
MKNRGSRFDKRLSSQGAGFQRPVANLAPALLLNVAPLVQRTAHTFGAVIHGTERGVNGQVNSAAGDQRPVGEVTVANNNFGTGRAILYVGDYEFIAGVDFLVGAAAANTATNLAAAISALPGWDAAAVGAVVTINASPPGRIRFEVRHFGTIVNYTTLTGLAAAALTESNLLNDRGLTTGPPVLTP